jgi:2,3-bisphosphoglycerate-independent phosphoglycerate mutase
MDRDEKWDRIKKTYALLTSGEGEKIKKVSDFIKESYAKEISDEFIEPAAITDDSGAPVGIIKDNDALIIFNFREDSMREISEAFVKEKFDHFERKKLVNFFLVTMTEYEKKLPATMIAFPPLDINFPLGRVVSEAGLRQLRIAETEKYAHVTYFFNGGKEKHFVGEDRLLIPSLPAAHFDEVPEMKSAEITAKIIENYENYDLIIANFANADMVGHTGNFSSAVKAVEALDKAIGELSSAVLEKNGAMVVTADHGNIELKMNPITGERITEHSLNPVPLFLVGNEFKLKKEKNEETILKQKSEIGGVLTDIAPTILELLGLKKPEEMTGKSLLEFLKNQN